MTRTPALLLELLLPVSLLAVAQGCGGSLAQPFDQMKNSPMTVYLLKNYQEQEAPAPSAATPGQPTGLNTFIQQGAALLQQWFPGVQLPAGMIPGAATPGAAPAASPYPPFHDYTVLAFKQITDSSTQSDVATLFGTDKNFNSQPGACFYPELGFAIANPSGQTADILVSTPCSQVRAFNITWPYGGNVGMTDDAKTKIDAIVRKVFSGG
jgi:hypothetical protein